MARMIPPQKRANINRSEEGIFDALMYSPVKWIVFPSLYWRNPANPLAPRELDFVILIPDTCSIMYVEVKGGGYEFEHRDWYREGATVPEKQSPVEQAQSGMFALKDKFEELLRRDPRLGSDSLLSFVNCVVFLDYEVSKEVARLAVPEDLTKTSKLIGRSIARSREGLIKALSDYAGDMRTRQRTLRTQVEWKIAQLQLKAVESIVDTERIPITDGPFYRTDLHNLLPELLGLTPSQTNALRQTKRRVRCVISGAAGSGKTVLAMDVARQRSENDGQVVGFLCSNPILASRFERWATTLSTEKGGRVVAGTPASILANAFPEDDAFLASHRQRLAESPHLEETLKRGALDIDWEDFVRDTLEGITSVAVPFDYLVVDEAQNLCDRVFLRLLDRLLKGGIVDGSWAMFGDFDHQDIVTPRRYDDGDALDVLGEFGVRSYPEIPLDTNCRNTFEIANKTFQVTAIEAPTLRYLHGPPVDIHYFDSPEEIDDLIDEQLNKLRGHNFSDRQIILLTSGGDIFDTGRRYAGDRWSLVNIRDVPIGTSFGEDSPANVVRVSDDRPIGSVRYSDVYDFQGLESDLVILVMPRQDTQALIMGGITLPNYDHMRRMLYIGMSRAGVMLIIIAHRGYERFLERPGL